jgi:hypothetical protein
MSKYQQVILYASDNRAYHDHNAFDLSIFDVFRDRFDRSALQSLWRSLIIHHARLFLTHPVAPSFAFAFILIAFPTLLRVAPRLALLELLAVRLVFATYFEDMEAFYND